MTQNAIDKVMQLVPNKYNLKTSDISKLIVKDWDGLKKKKLYYNAAMTDGRWYCHLEGSQEENQRYNDEDEFWIGFDESSGKVAYHFSAFSGMCGYKFKKFYDIKTIENKFDLNVQKNALRFVNMLLDEGICSL